MSKEFGDYGMSDFYYIGTGEMIRKDIFPGLWGIHNTTLPASHIFDLYHRVFQLEKQIEELKKGDKE